MWTEITRPKYVRMGLRYASDLSDGEWRVIAPPAVTLPTTVTRVSSMFE